MKKYKKIFIPKSFFAFLFLSVLFFNFGQVGHCAQVTLAWDPNSESNVAGYKIYYGKSSKNYQKSIDVGKVTTYTLDGLIGQTYYIAATAYNTEGLESDFSNEVVCSVRILPWLNLLLGD